MRFQRGQLEDGEKICMRKIERLDHAVITGCVCTKVTSVHSMYGIRMYARKRVMTFNQRKEIQNHVRSSGANERILNCADDVAV